MGEAIDQFLATGEASLSRRDWPAAIAAFREAAAGRPDSARAHVGLAHALREAGRPGDAIASYQRAIELAPNGAAAYEGQALALLATGDAVRAAACFQAAIRVNPRYDSAYRHFADLLLQQRQAAAAVQVLSMLMEAAPGSFTAKDHFQLGMAHAQQRTFGPAVEQFRRAVAAEPAYGAAWLNLGLALEASGDTASAVEAMRQAARFMPSAAMVEYQIASLGGGKAPEMCPAPYVQTLFDSYAPTFDQHLVQALNYQGPKLLHDLVTAAVPPATAAAILDVGCGTGLCGEIFRPLASKLVGIDLSARMLDIARGRKVYDELVQGEIVEAMNAMPPASFDLILSGDVFIYFGRLDDMFAAAQRVLRRGGSFAFTIEVAPADRGDYVLNRSRRYAHSLSYTRQLATAHGFDLVSERQAFLRRDETGDLQGAAFLLGDPRPDYSPEKGNHR